MRFDRLAVPRTPVADEKKSSTGPSAAHALRHASSEIVGFLRGACVSDGDALSSSRAFFVSGATPPFGRRSRGTGTSRASAGDVLYRTFFDAPQTVRSSTPNAKSAGEAKLTAKKPAGTTQCSHVKCEVKPEWLRLQVSTLHAAPLLVDGQLFYPVKPAECSWALEDAKGGGGRWLTLSLEKAHQNMRWLDLTRKAGVSYHKAGDKDSEEE